MTLRRNCRWAQPPVSHKCSPRSKCGTRKRTNCCSKDISIAQRERTEDRQKAGEYFVRAIAADPGYALAYADLSDIYQSLANSGLLDPKEYLPKAREAAQKALELDEGLADGHYALANLMTYSWEWADAEREYKRAIELNPNLALAHRWYATYLRLMGRHEQAISEITRARELDPLSPGVNATVGYVLSSARRYDQAILALNKTIELDRSLSLHAICFSATRMPLKASMRRPSLRTRKAIALGLDTPATQVYLGAAAAHAGDRPRALAILERLRSSKERSSRSRTGDSADGARRAGTGVRVARRRVSSTGYPAAIPWCRARVRSAALGPPLRGSDETGRPHQLTHPWTSPFHTQPDSEGSIVLDCDSPRHFGRPVTFRVSGRPIGDRLVSWAARIS